MKFTTKDGLEFSVLLKDRVAHRLDAGTNPIKYHAVSGIYVGSKEVAFLDANDNELLVIKDEVVSVENDPNELDPEFETTNVIFLTQNSAYEIDPEQKQVRRLTGLNDPTPSQGPNGDWKTYDYVSLPGVGLRAFIKYLDVDRGTLTSTVREIRGTFPTLPEVLVKSYD